MSTTTTGSSDLPVTPPVGRATAAKQAEVSTPRAMVAIDSPAMKFAIATCGEIFPGAPVEVEILTDPDDPERSWYCLNVPWPGEPRDCIDRSSRWYDRLDAEYREVISDFVILVTPI
jgi:hypothetical protein